MRRALVWGAALLPSLAMAGSVYLNNVNIDGVTNQKFEKATVRIDEKGNVHIDAPGYAVRAVDPSKPSAAATVDPGNAKPQLTKKYWLVTEQNPPGMTEFDIDLYINSKWVRKLRNAEDQIVSDITRYLVPGKNTILLTARKVSGSTRKSFSPDHIFRVIIGEGSVGGNNVVIDNPMVRFERTAAEAADVSQEFLLQTR